MALVVKNNMQATGTLNQLDKNADLMAKDLKKVSSGMKINSAADDASGYSITDRMDVQMKSLYQDNQNVQTGNSMLKVAEGALTSTTDILRTLKEKVINAANDTNTDTDRASIQKELDQAVDQINDNANLEYNGQALLNGSRNGKVVGNGTYATFSNSELADDIDPYNTPMTEYRSRSGNSLGIEVGDNITVSYVKAGKTHIGTTVTVDEYTVFSEIFQQAIPAINVPTEWMSDSTYAGTDQYGTLLSTKDTTTPKNVITFASMSPGIFDQVSGLTFNVVRKNGQVNKDANASLDKFEETVFPQNPTIGDGNPVVLHTGTKANQNIAVGLADMSSVALGLEGIDTADGNRRCSLDVGTRDSANAAINVLDNALSNVLNQQVKIGSVENRLGYTSMNLTIAGENTESSMSVIRDSDMAKEQTQYVKDSILTQTAQAMLAQANTTGSAVLSLLQ